MKILLINPWIYDFAAFDLWAKPLGLLYIGSFLEKFGYKVSLSDCLWRHHPEVKEKIKLKKYATGKFFSEEVEKPPLLKNIPRKYKRYGIPRIIFENDLKEGGRPDLIIITSIMTYWYPGVFDAISIIKKIFPDTPIILGGIYACLCSDHAKKYSQADYIIPGDGKIECLKIADSISGKKRSYDKINTDLDQIPYPAYHLYEEIDSISMITSLGCPLNCTYCASSFIQPDFIERAPDEVFKEILYYREKFEIKDIAFYDDALLINSKARFIPLVEKIIKQKLNIRFHTPNGLHIRLINEKIADLFYKAGFKTLRLSFESSIKRIQNSSSMKTTNQDLISAKKCLRNAGYNNEKIETYVMVGLPYQDRNEIIDAVRFVHDLGLKVKLVEYSPIPHTVDYEKTITKYKNIGTDPLLHNNSIFSMLTDEVGYKNLMEIKDLVADLNRKL